MATDLEFTCDQCEQTFWKERTDEEARAEADAQWPDPMPGGEAVVCHDCYIVLMASIGIEVE